MNPKEELFEKLCLEFEKCAKCVLHKYKQSQDFIGSGNYNPDIFILNEHPDYPVQSFINDKLYLNEETLNYKTYIACTICSKPPEDREPLYEEEVLKCVPRILYTIYLLRPKMIVALGSVAAKALLPNLKPPLKNHIGKPIQFDISDLSSILYITYHPKYLEKAPSNNQLANLHWAEIKGMLRCLKTFKDKIE